jgi:hypothetical protein
MGCAEENTGQSDTLIASLPACLRGTGVDVGARGGMTTSTSKQSQPLGTLALSQDDSGGRDGSQTLATTLGELCLKHRVLDKSYRYRQIYKKVFYTSMEKLLKVATPQLLYGDFHAQPNRRSQLLIENP